MQAVKKVEIVTDSLEVPELLASLERIGITSYTLVKDVLGRGERGIQRGDELTDVFKNSMLLIACEAEQVPALVETVRPILKKHGGICLISDVQWVIH